MDRRKFVRAVASTLVIVPVAVKAQQAAQVRRIGWLCNFGPLTPADFQQYIATFNLAALGWTEGQNLIIEPRYTSGDASLLPGLAKELVLLNVDLIVAEGTIVALAAKQATSTTPIVVIWSGDPVRVGLVASLARPGANITGTTTITPDLDQKRLQILHELMPAAKRVGELVVPANPIDRLTRDQYERTYNSLGMQPIFVEVTQAGDLENAVAEAARRGAQLLHVSSEPLLGSNFSEIMRAAQKYSLPIMADNSGYLENGALVSYGPDNADLQRLLAFVINKVLRGAKPADVPIQQPLKLELGINLKAAKAFGIKIPPSLLLRADKVIE